jgi:hypothetical protein
VSVLASKYDELLQTALAGYREVATQTPEEHRDWLKSQPFIPPNIPGEGGTLFVTQGGLLATRELGRLWYANSPGMRSVLSEADAVKNAESAFGKLLHGAKSMPGDAKVKDKFKELMQAEVQNRANPGYHYFPVRAFEQKGLRSIVVGPVVFERPISWLNHTEKISGSPAPWRANVIKRWRPKKSERKDPNLLTAAPSSALSLLEQKAEDIIKFIGAAEWVARVLIEDRTANRSLKCAESAVTVALDSLALGLPRSAGRNLRGPGDDLQVRMLRSLSQYNGQELSQGLSIDLPRVGGTPGYQSIYLKETKHLRKAVGLALHAHIKVSSTDKGAELKRRWVEAMFWFGQSRREDNDFIALVKIGVALDVLTEGGMSGGIIKLLCQLSGWTPEKSITSDNKTVRQIVELIYNEGRSRIAHGTRLSLQIDLPISVEVADNVAKQIMTVYVLCLAKYGGKDNYGEFFDAIPGLLKAI